MLGTLALRDSLTRVMLETIHYRNTGRGLQFLRLAHQHRRAVLAANGLA